MTKSCSNCNSYRKIKGEFGLCETFDIRMDQPGKRCKYWKGIKYYRKENKKQFEEIMRIENHFDEVHPEQFIKNLIECGFKYD